MSAARLLELPMAGLIAALGGEGSLAYGLVMGMARQAETTAKTLERAYGYTSPQRLAAHLLTLIAPNESRHEGQLPYEKSLLAQSLGMTPETLSRAFLGLRRLGVRTQGRGFSVADTALLRTYCGLESDASDD